MTTQRLSWLRPDLDGAPRLIGMIHLPPLPGSPRAAMDFETCLEQARGDAELWAEAGADALLIENHGDTPFSAGAAEPHVVATLALATQMLRERFALPVGVNCLRNDALGALGAAAAAGGDFVRVNVLLGAAATDQGLIQGIADRLLRYRRTLSSSVAILADVEVKFATPLYRPPLPDLVKGLVHRGGADALIVTGSATGQAPARDEVEGVLAHCGATPLILGSGVSAENAAELARGCAAAIVGTAAKRDGDVDAPVDIERARAIRTALSAARS